MPARSNLSLIDNFETNFAHGLWHLEHAGHIFELTAPYKDKAGELSAKVIFCMLLSHFILFFWKKILLYVSFFFQNLYLSFTIFF